jgi:hypothetical protein
MIHEEVQEVQKNENPKVIAEQVDNDEEDDGISQHKDAFMKAYAGMLRKK